MNKLWANWHRPFVSVALVLALVSGLFASVPAGAQEAAKPPLKIVQLGDSYSAGNGARDAGGDRNYVGVEGCYRSPTNWGSQFIDTLRDEFRVTYVNRACSGGVVPEITGERRFKNAITGQLVDCPEPEFPDEEFWVRTDGIPFDRCQRILFPQINAVDESVDLVLMTGGGNDAQFAKVVEQCFVPGYRDPGGCRDSVDFARGQLETIEERLTDTFRELREKMRDDAKIVFVSYPYLIDDIDYELVSRLFGFERDRFDAATEVRELGRLGDIRQRAAVDAINAEVGEELILYVDDIKDLFAGRAPNPVQSEPFNPDRWLYEALETTIPAEYYHYKPMGHEAIADLLTGQETDFMLGGNPGAGGGGADLDVVFVVDTTGSMGGEIAQVRANLTAFVNQLEDTTDSFRVGLVTYRDFPERTGSAIDYPARVDQTFTNDLASIQAAIDSLTASGGGDFPETVFSGLDAAFGLSWRPGVTKVAIVIGDAPALSPEPISGLTAQQLVAKSLAIDPVQVVAVDVGSLSEPGILEITTGTGGSIEPSAGDLIGAISRILDNAATQPFAWPGGPYAGEPGQSISFDSSGSFDPSGVDVALYEWDFDGDGEYDLATSETSVSHIYDAEYEGVVVLRVTGAEGVTALGSTRIEINSAGSASQGDDATCEVDETGRPILLSDDGIPLLCTVEGLPTEDLEGVTVEGPDPCATPTIEGTNGRDVLEGTSGDDVIVSHGGNDRIEGNGGNDVICSFGGNNHIITGDGNDLVITGQGNDHVVTGEGDDEIFAGDGNNRVDSGLGNDLVVTGAGNDQISVGDGDDSAWAGGGNDRIVASTGTDQINGEAGRDVAAEATGEDRCEDVEKRSGCSEVSDIGPPPPTPGVDSQGN